MTDPHQTQSWLTAIAEAARRRNVLLPPFTAHGMGTARTRTVAGGRFVTFKRRLVPDEQAEIDGVEWTLWFERDDVPVPVAVFREPAEPTSEMVADCLALLEGWLVDQWPPHKAKAAIGQACGASTGEWLRRTGS